MSTINFRYTPNTGDYVNGLRAQLWRRLFTRAWLASSALVILGILAYLAYSILQGKPSGSPQVVLPLLLTLLPVAAPWLIYFAVMPLSLHRRVNGDKRLRCDTFGLADEQGLILRHRFGETRMNWDAYATFFETRGLFLLPHTANRQLYQVIPKRAFESVQAEATFRELLQRKVTHGRGAALGEAI